MKCLLVLNQLNDPFYIDYDASFAEFIIDRSKEKGLLEQNSETVELDANLVMQLFSPLVLSQWLLIDQTKEPCSAIHCPNGFRFVFKHVDDLLFLAINGDGSESETFLHRKIKVFIRLMRFMFGPVSEEMGLSHLVSKKAKWDFLRRVTRHWSVLVDTEQEFLVEAIERLHVNQVVSEKSVEILEKAVKQIQAARDLPTQHALLLVNNKLLALYSNRSAHELQPKDILSVMILAGTMYPQTERLEDLFSRQYTGSQSKSEAPCSIEDNSDGGEEEYHSAPNTPGGGNRSRSSSVKSAPNIDIEVTDERRTKTVPANLTVAQHSADSSSQPSLSEPETLKYTASSDLNSASQADGKKKGVSLLDMYKEKYPDSLFKEQDWKDFKLSSSKKSVPESVPGKVSVEVIVHKEAEPDEITENLQEATETAGKEPPLHSEDTSLHESNVSKNSQDHSGKVDQEKSVSTDSTHASKEREPPDSERASERDMEKPVLSKTEQSVSHDYERGSHGSDLGSKQNTQKLPPETKATTESDAEVKQKEQSATTERLGPKKTSLGAEASQSSQGTNSNRSTPSFLHPDSSQKVQETRTSRSATMSSGQSHGESSAVSEVSRSSSAISHTSQSYPELTAHIGDSFISTERSSQRPPSTGIRQGPKRISPMRISPNPQEMRTTDSSMLTYPTVGSVAATTPSRSAHYSPQTVFLKTSTCRYSPYNIHTAQVLPGVTLVLLSQAPRHIFADYLYQVIHNIQDLLYGRRSELPRSRSLYVYDIINSQLAKLHNNLKKFKGKVRNLSYDIHARWEKEDLKRKLLDFLERDKRTPIPPELESPLLELYKRLKELFSCLFLYPIPETPQLSEALSQLRVRVNAELLDYREYLNVKAQRNITMTSYIDDFPGLIHFIFIDRHFHQITAPSLNISANGGESMDATSYLKQKIWQMYQCMMTKLTDGYTTVMMREGDFYFSYFLWFEDYAGNALPVQESFKPSRALPYPGILAGSFYSKLLRYCFPQSIHGSVRCFEMFLLHIGSVHPQYVAAHCKKLAAKMWEMTGEPYTTASLF